MKKNLKILNMRYLDYDGNDITIGGVQTYITNLATVAFGLGMSVEVYQFANNTFNKDYQNIKVHGVKVDINKDLKIKKNILYNECMKSYSEEDILIFGTDLLIVKTKKPFALGIQHGIGWDIESTEQCARMKNVIQIVRQARRSLVTTKQVSYLRKLVCVDYNYINWYRTQILHHEMEYEVIPNFTHVPEKNTIKQKDNTIRIIFARRLVPYRGTRIFADVVELLLNEFSNIDITFAGDGPDETMLRRRFSESGRVHFITYNSEDSLKIHSDKHIAVVPTIGSEGTSLSLLEAMASSCAVVCTNVGGMTNIVIDRFNGRIVNPEVASIYAAIRDLIVNCKERVEIASAGYDTVKSGFSFDVWKEKWEEILVSID